MVEIADLVVPFSNSSVHVSAVPPVSTACAVPPRPPEVGSRGWNKRATTAPQCGSRRTCLICSGTARVGTVQHAILLFLQINRGRGTPSIDQLFAPFVVVWKTLHIYTHPENNPSPISFRRLTPSSRCLGSLAVSDSHQITQISSLLVAFVVSLLSRQAPLSSPLQQVL